MNILNKQGFLTDLDREEKLERVHGSLRFITNLDLSEPVKVMAIGGAKRISFDLYSKDLASFISWWTIFVMKDLNGFSGFGNVKFEFVGFNIV